MKTLIVLLIALVAITKAASDDQAKSDNEAISREWNSFKVNKQKAYGSEAEEKNKKDIFTENKRLIDAHNSKYDHGLVSFKLGINKYTDMSLDEFARTMNGFKPGSSKDNKKPEGVKFSAPSLAAVPDEVDWRKQGAVTGVKDQGDCGACWAFSALGALEAHFFKKTGQLLSLSEQNLMDCSGPYGTGGCEGGDMISAFRYIIENRGIESTNTYKYEGKVGKCHYDQWKVAARITGFVTLPPGDEVQLKSAIANYGPVSAGVDGYNLIFQFYESGILDYSDGCSSTNINHAVVIVGYGSEKGKKYWLVKNSYGVDWGEKGYIRIARDQKNMCGIATQASYPVV